MIVASAGCAGLQGGPAVVAPPSGAQAKLTEAQKKHAALRRRLAAFYTELASVGAKIDGLYGRPHWSEFERILVEYPTLRDPDKEPVITPAIRARLAQWSRRAGVPWQTMMRDYTRLVNSCALLEMKRVAARQRVISVQAAYMAVVMMDAGKGDKEDASQIYAIVTSLDKLAARLEAIHVNRLGLYSHDSVESK